MSKDPFYPELPEGGAEQAQALVDKFKEKLRRVADEVLGELYTDIVPYIESDSWTNFRNSLMDGFQGYDHHDRLRAPYDFLRIRQKIFSEHREELVKDLNQDLLAEIDRLKGEVKHLKELISDRRYT